MIETRPLNRVDVTMLVVVVLALVLLTIWIWRDPLPPCPPGGSPEPCDWRAR